MTALWRHALLAALVVVGLTRATLAPPATASAGPASEWLALGREMAAPWASLQRKTDASFSDYVVAAAPKGPPRDPYGRAFLGLALLQAGLRDGDDVQLAAGLRAVGYAASHPAARDKRIVFENLALETAYNVARRALGQDRRFAAIRGALEARIKHITVAQLVGSRRYYNYYLVEAAGLMEALDSGLTSSVRGSALANRSRTRRLILNLVNRTLPAVAARYSTTDPAGRLAVLSDPPWNPPAYDAFSLALLARVADGLGHNTSGATRNLMRAMARSLWVLASPEGSVSYYGRSQDQSWTLAMTAYGAQAAADLQGTSAGDAARFEALAARVLTRLRDRYAGGQFGFWITPALADGIRGAIPGLDAYADAASYSGLTLVGMNWALEQMDAGGPAPGPLAADAEGVHRIASGPSATVIVRTPTLWFAVKQGPGVRVTGVGDYSVDVRYDSGLLALQMTTPAAQMTDIVPLRPHPRHADDRSEPVLVRGRRAGRFWGQHLRVMAGSRVQLTGGFRDGGRWLRRGVRMEFAPNGCGLRQSLATRRGDRIEQSLWTRGTPRVGSGRRVLLARGEQITLGASPRRMSFRSGYASGAEQGLTRVKLQFVGTGKPLTIDFCPRSAGS